MAPEQFFKREIDTRADIYSFGIVLFQMVAENNYPYPIIEETNKRRIDRFCEVRKIIRDIKGVSVQSMVFTKDELNTRIKIADDFIMDVLKKGEVLYG